jgi:anti-anti-sigma regulatory factor
LGEQVLTASRPLEIDNVTWAIVAEIGVTEAFADSRVMARNLLLLLAILIPVVVLVARLVSRSLTGPISMLAEQADRITGGDLHATISTTGSDEIGDLARRFASMRDSVAALVERQERAIEALSTPIIPFGNDMIVLPLVGEMDEVRITRLRAELAEAIHDTGALYVAIDLTGVPEMEPAVVAQLGRAARAARLLGARVALTGMMPEVAQTIAGMDTEFSGVEGARTLELGLAKLRAGDNSRSTDSWKSHTN